MKLHTNRRAQISNASIALQRQAMTGNAVLPETPAPPLNSIGPAIHDLEQPRLFDQSLLASPYAHESENLLDWLMSDF